MKRKLAAIVALGLASTVLGGCAVYGPPPAYYGAQPAYYGQGGYNQAPGGYYPSQPVYAPAPVYVAPPVSIGLGFGFWGGHGRHHY